MLRRMLDQSLLKMLLIVSTWSAGCVEKGVGGFGGCQVGTLPEGTPLGQRMVMPARQMGVAVAYICKYWIA